MIPMGDGWYYLAVKKLSTLLRGMTSKNDDDFYYLSRLQSFRTKNKLESHKKVYKNKDFCNIVILSKDIKLIKFNQY